jgi:hypothetical protein
MRKFLGVSTLVVIAGFGGSMLVYATQAHSHDAIPTNTQPLGWNYPWACCASQDCRAALVGEVTESPDGYVITATGEIVPMLDKRVKDSPDGVFHICAHLAGIDAGKTICLFKPDRGF